MYNKLFIINISLIRNNPSILPLSIVLIFILISPHNTTKMKSQYRPVYSSLHHYVVLFPNLLLFNNVIINRLLIPYGTIDYSYYCKYNVMMLYNNVREPFQWTLDRIDNSKPHNTDNVVISCLKCNLERRRRSEKKFLMSKQMKIIKKNT